jgi:hypothetical protein
MSFSPIIAKVTMKSPRIYTYKVTFEEIPHWYWGVHKEQKYDDGYLGSPVTHKWMWDFYTPHLQICEEFPYTDEGWKEAHNIEDRMIRPDLNNPLCLNESCGGLVSLYSSRKAALKMNQKIHADRDEEGKSLHTLKLHEVKNEEGKSLLALKVCKVIHADKNEEGKSRLGIENAKRLNAEKNEEGKSLAALRGVTKVNEKKNKEGKSLAAVKGGMRGGKKAHEKKDENGKSLYGIEVAKRLNSQVWESQMDGFRSNAGAVARHNKANGWDPNARFRVK